MDYEKAYTDALNRAKNLKEMYPQDAAGYEEVFPELTESEDEKNANALIRFLNDNEVSSLITYEAKLQWLAWLEKQKDNLGKIEALKDALAKQPVFKPVTWEDVKRIVRIADGMMHPAESLVDAEIRLGIEQYYQQVLEKFLSEKLKESLHVPESCKENPDSFTDEHPYIIYTEMGEEFAKQKEQNPAEYLPKQKVFDIMNKLTNLSYSERIPIDSEEYVKIHEITSDVNSLLDYPIEQKPSWSEEDEKMKERLITRLNWITYNTRTDGTSPNITFFDEIEWLKSLRPPQYCENCRLKKSVQGWKPSEEQMSMLLAVIRDPNNAGSESCHLALESLLEDLKKL